ncbi:MAG TPA: OmpA family protein [Nitrospira sp.]
MRSDRIRHRRTLVQASLIASVVLIGSGCVSTDTHQKALDELEKSKKLSASQAAEMDEMRRKSKAESDQFQQQLAGLQQNLDQETSQRKSAEQQAASLGKEREALTARSTELQNRLEGLEREKNQLGSELGDVRAQIATLEKKLADETANVTALESDKQQLASGTATAQSEIVKLRQKQAELEAESARIAKEREQLRQEQSRLSATLDQERQRLKAEAEEKARLQQEQSQLSASLDEERKRLKAEAEEKARLEQAHAAKEEEIRRLTKTQEELSQSLKDEIAKGNIKIQQVRDRLTINMVDRVLFDSGRAVIKPAGVKVLKQVGDVLNKITDKQIRIEGHTDNVPISTKLQDKFKTNWELSTARATTVVRYLIDQGGVQPQALSAVGYADTHPIASNESEEGRSSNRRIEIVLYPKDLSQVAAQ